MDVIISTYSEHVYSDNIVLHIASFGCVRAAPSRRPAQHRHVTAREARCDTDREGRLGGSADVRSVQILAYFGSLTCFFLLLSETFLVQKAMYRRANANHDPDPNSSTLTLSHRHPPGRPPTAARVPRGRFEGRWALESQKCHP